MWLEMTAAEPTIRRFGSASLVEGLRAATPALLFGLRLWASVCLSLYVAFTLELSEPTWAATTAALVCQPEAQAAGYGGVTMVARATGVARSTINRGLKDLQARDPAPSKVRRSGGGRPALTQTDPTLLEDLRALLESTTLGDPMRPLLWVSKSHAKLAQALREMGHRVSASRIPQL